MTIARANWSTGYMQAAIYAALLEELGYTVSDPSDLELAPSNAFVAMANGEFDFWANSWFPNHNQFLAGAMPDGSLVSDHVTTLGFEMRTGGLQGLLTNKSLVDEHGIRTLDQIVNDPALFAIYDAGDSSPDDGVIQILGCPDGWGCHVNINSWIENAGWANVEQVEVGSYDALIADAISRDASGAPYIVYTWAPSAYVGDLRAGDNAIWLSTSDESVSPTQVAGPAVLGAGQCSSDPCNLGWDAADIRVTANSDFLAANPAAARLFELVTINPVDVALQNVTYSLGANTEADVRSHAAEWIADNRATVDVWLAVAQVPPGDTPGAGVSVNAARANWSTGYMQAAIYAALLEELGYTVSDPSDLELAPSNAFVAMANGEFDFWANSWFPNHNQFLAGAMPDGSLVSDHVTTLGFEMRTGGLQGLLTNKSLVDEHGIPNARPDRQRPGPVRHLRRRGQQPRRRSHPDPGMPRRLGLPRQHQLVDRKRWLGQRRTGRSRFLRRPDRRRDQPGRVRGPLHRLHLGAERLRRRPAGRRQRHLAVHLGRIGLPPPRWRDPPSWAPVNARQTHATWVGTQPTSGSPPTATSWQPTRPPPACSSW